ncbi:hypothetical protein OHS81_35455 [Streptomyces sp. NBC_00400]|uniref:hypothetical protein n=1 Tax=Streptomyces sp. NBC_00400 TaxID=2975737 RepID=UPI002E1C40BB
MPGHQRRHLALPADFAAVLRRMRTKRDRRLNSVLHAAVAVGWTKQSLANALGCSHQNVAQRMQQARAQREVSLPAIPLPPPKPDPEPQPDRARRKRFRNPAVAARLRELQVLATTVRGGMPSSAPARKAGEELAALLADLHYRQAVAIMELSRVMGVGRPAIQSRLSRHGYRPLPPCKATQRYQNVSPIVRDECSTRSTRPTNNGEPPTDHDTGRGTEPLQGT